MTRDRKYPPVRSLSPIGVPVVRASLISGACVLVVDGDGVSRRFVEISLTTKGEGPLSVELARDASTAFEILHNTLVDLIVAEVDLPDMSGLRFHRRLLQESRLRSIPFMFLSADTRVATKLVALRAGVDDYITKPCDVQELASRVEAIIGRHRRQRDAFRRRGYVLAGDFSALAFPDLVGMLEMGRRTGTLALATPRGVGELFSSGQLVHAVFGNLTGAEAFYMLLGEETGKFEFSPDEASSETTIRDSVTSLIMEGARLLDTRRSGRGLEPARSEAISVRDSSPPGSILHPAVPASPHLGAHFQQGIADAFVLGELRLWTAEDLARWTEASAGRERLHVVAFADLAAGASAVLSLAGAPTERWVVGALSDDPKVLGLAFFLRFERVLDLVLLDVRNATRFQKSCRRTPSIVLVAPPQGDFFDIGTKSRVELDNALQVLNPTALVAVGNGVVDDALRELSSVRRRSTPVRALRGALGDPATDFRAILVEAVRFWSTCGGPPHQHDALDTRRRA